MSRRNVHVREAYVVESEANQSSRLGQTWLLLMVVIIALLVVWKAPSIFVQELAEGQSNIIPAQLMLQPQVLPTPSPRSLETQNVMYPTAGGHHIELANSPDFQIDFTAIFQCRERAISNTLVEEYVMAWGIMHRDSRLHIKNGQISLELLSKAPYMSLMNGDNLIFGANLGAGHGAFVQAKDGNQAIVSGNGSQIGGARLSLLQTDNPIDVEHARSHYQTVVVIEQVESYSVLASYSQHDIEITLINNGDMKMRNVQVVGIVAESTAILQDHVLDLVEMATPQLVIEERAQQQIRLISPAYMDRCVQRQLTENEPKLHLWVTYTSVDDAHVLTDYIEIDSLEQGAIGNG